MAVEIDLDHLTPDMVARMDERPWLIAEAEALDPDIREKLAKIRDKAASDEEKAASSGDYDSLNIKQLRDAAENRQLDRSGSKADLVSRLKDEDERLAGLRQSGNVSINENPGDSVLNP